MQNSNVNSFHGQTEHNWVKYSLRDHLINIFLMVHRHTPYRKSYITDFVQNSSHCNMVITIFVIRGYGDQKSIKEWIFWNLIVHWCPKLMFLEYLVKAPMEKKCNFNKILPRCWRFCTQSSLTRIAQLLSCHHKSALNWQKLDVFVKSNLYGFWLQLLFWSDFCLHSWWNLCLLIWVFSYQKCQETAWTEFWSEKQLLTELTKDIFCK